MTVRDLVMASRPLTLNTVTFTFNQTWTSPAGVTSLATLTGTGGTGTPGYWYTGTVGFARTQNGTIYSGASNLGIGDYSQPYGFLLSYVNELNSGGSGERTVTWRQYYYQYVDQQAVDSYSFPSSELGKTYLAAYIFGTRTIRGVAVADWGSSPTSGTIASTNVYYYNAQAEIYAPNTPGANSSAFGYTFTGGSSGPATPVTYNNVAINPGSFYTITVASGGSITITYYT